MPTSPISGARKARGGPPRWEGSATIAARVTAARARQSARGDGLLNACVDGAALTAVCTLDHDGETLSRAAAEAL
ncbi:MAG: hypothetical protein VX123_10200 [Pseudomonadota bacterium]|nr:hypothetical protein [Pseudomonadota bacterium]